jgi:hypothetical protein
MPRAENLGRGAFGNRSQFVTGCRIGLQTQWRPFSRRGERISWFLKQTYAVLRRACLGKVEQVELLSNLGRKPREKPATEATPAFQTLPKLLVRVKSGNELVITSLFRGKVVIPIHSVIPRVYDEKIISCQFLAFCKERSALGPASAA